MLGAVLSILIPEAVAEALLPALSEQLPVADSAVPSLVNVTTGLQLAMPDSASVPSKLTVTSVLFQPAPLADGIGVAVTVGAVLSMFTPLTDADALFPARSVTVNVWS